MSCFGGLLFLLRLQKAREGGRPRSLKTWLQKLPVKIPLPNEHSCSAGAFRGGRMRALRSTLKPNGRQGLTEGSKAWHNRYSRLRARRSLKTWLQNLPVDDFQ